MHDIPVLTTERLRLRGHTVADYAASSKMWADPEVTRYIGGKPSSASQTWQRVLGYAGHWALMNFGYWVVEESASSRFAGEVGFADFKRDIDASMREVPELGWAFAPEFHGKGYATEAVRAALAWSDRHFEQPRTVCLISPENAASIRVAGKCGFAEFGRSRLNTAPVVLFERFRPYIPRTRVRNA
ncbi:MAG: GNAT family N-acetyltransferase [Candidatus Velthaea sp.]